MKGRRSQPHLSCARIHPQTSWAVLVRRAPGQLESLSRRRERSTRQGTRAWARRENDEEHLDCRNVLEHIHHALMINNDAEYMLARAGGSSRSHKLDNLLINHDYSWSAFWSRPQATRCQSSRVKASGAQEAVGKGRFQLARCAAKRKSLTSARGRFEVNIHTETLDMSSGLKLGMNTALKSAGKPWSRTLTTQRGGEIQV